MQSRPTAAHHSRGISMMRNTQGILLLAGLFGASLTGCILEPRTGSDVADLSAWTDLRVDQGSQCGSDGILFMGKCIYDFYQPDSPSCTGKSITLYDQVSQFKQTCDCVCDRTSLAASLSYSTGPGTGCMVGTMKISTTQQCYDINPPTAMTPPTGANQFQYSPDPSSSCIVTSASQTSWKLNGNPQTSHTYCLLSTEDHRAAKQECIIVDGSITECPSTHSKVRILSLPPKSLPNYNICNCCASGDYPDIPIVLYSGPCGMQGIQLKTFPQQSCGPSGSVAKSASWNSFHCPDSYSKTIQPTLLTGSTQTACCKQ